MAAKTEKELRLDIVEIGKIVWQKGWVAANDGNITIRLDQDRVLATPTGICKGMMTPDDLIIVDMQGRKIEGRRECTSEVAMHLTIYRLRPDIKAVVHAHPPVSTGFATAGRPLTLALLPEVVIGLGCVPLASYGLPGTPALTEPMLPLIPKYDAIMMGNHGAVCYGEDVFKAFFRMETVEHFARITLVAELLGGPNVLPREEVDKLFDSRTRYGVKARSGPVPGCPVVAEDLSPGAPAEDAGKPEARNPEARNPGARNSAMEPGALNPAAPHPGAPAQRASVPAPEPEAASAPPERFWVTRDELIALVDEALRARGRT